MDIPAPQAEHQWLQKLVGKWTFESSCQGPDGPPIISTGTEVVRSLGGLWTIGEGESDAPGGGKWASIMTLGYDPQAKRFVGTFVASVMTHLWPYNGSLDATGKILTLDSEGPGFSGDGSMAKYQDIIEFIDHDHRTLSSQCLGDDGQWHQFMQAHYYRQAQ
jgi:hypothetical protein